MKKIMILVMLLAGAFVSAQHVDTPFDLSAVESAPAVSVFVPPAPLPAFPWPAWSYEDSFCRPGEWGLLACYFVPDVEPDDVYFGVTRAMLDAGNTLLVDSAGTLQAWRTRTGQKVEMFFWRHSNGTRIVVSLF